MFSNASSSEVHPLISGNYLELQYSSYAIAEAEKPPLAAIGEVIELIGHDWNHPEAWKEKQGQSQPYFCHFCSHLIQEQFLLKVGVYFCHEQCLRCCVCHESLTERCYEKEGYFYCSHHYHATYSPFQCAGCHLGIAPTEMVYKLKSGLIYHVHCHYCYLCGKQLSAGDQIAIDDTTKAVSCLSHDDSSPLSDIETTIDAPPTVSETVSKPETEKKKPSTSETLKKKEKSPITKKEKRLLKKESGDFTSGPSGSLMINPIIPQYPFEMYAFGEMYSDDGRLMKRRGPRTTIKQNQLDVLNQIFSSTPKPSKHARAKLALETGLSMRVIQVWFQNRRSKERRLKHLCNFLRHYEQQGLPPPPFNINPDDGTVITASGTFSPQTMQYLGIDGMNDDSFDYDDDTAELSN